MTPITAQRLIDLEAHYADGRQQRPMRVASPHDHRTPEQIARTTMLAGYRMADRGYAPIYEEHLKPHSQEDGLVIIECGVFLGVGLAVWCDVFPHATVIGLEYDLSYWSEYKATLIDRGAFKDNMPLVMRWDKLAPNAGRAAMAALPKGARVDILIDDAVHTDESIIKTVEDFRPHVAHGFTMFLEDNETVAPKLAEKFPRLDVTPIGQMTIARQRYGQ